MCVRERESGDMYERVCARKRKPGNEDWNYGCKKLRERAESKKVKKLRNGKSFCKEKKPRRKIC
jgi:hypothetical protein